MSMLHLLLNGNKNYRKAIRRKVIIGATMGVAIGAVGGILLATKPGKEIRADLAKAVQKFPDTVRQISEATRNKVEDMKVKIMEKKAAMVDDPKFKKVAEMAKEKIQSVTEKSETNNEDLK